MMGNAGAMIRASLRAAMAMGLALALPAPSLAQAPFTMGEQASDIPSVASPPAQQSIAEQEAGAISPENPATRTPQRRRTTGAFDVDGDGFVDPVVLPDDRQQTVYPSTTTSPLGLSPGSLTVQTLDAISAEQREELTRLLSRESESVRELRVNLGNNQEWVEALTDRPLVPNRTLRLDGEMDFASWNFFLSAAEAARGGTLSVAFTNSVLVLPEASRLRIFLNGRQIAQTAIDSPDRTKVIALPVSPDHLRAGQNAMRIEADMRHRVDCSLDATFELWTRIDTRLTGFSFEGPPTQLATLADLPAVGVGTTGATRIRVVQGAPASPDSVDRMLRAVQSAALRGRFVQPIVEVVDETADPEPSPGTLNIAIGVYEDLRRISPAVPADGAVGPLLAMVDTPEIGPTVVITGPTLRAVDTALSRFDAPTIDDQTPSPIAATPPWLVPEGVRIEGPASVTLQEAGVETINFSGRRFITSFTVTLPPDFYAAAYGEAILYLDAAYSADVEPGSRLSVFVNGTISTSISFTSSSGEVLEDFPVVLVMENFRPGVNQVEIVAELDTEADRDCLPGSTVPTRDRFALFSSTQLEFPKFARIGQIPNLASFATNGFPYNFTADPMRVFVGGSATDTAGAAGTLIARLAVSRGARFPTIVVDEVGPFANAGLVVVAPLTEVPNLMLDATGVADVVPASWLQPANVAQGPGGLERYNDVLRRLRTEIREEEVRLNAGVGLDTALAEPLDQHNETLSERERWFQEVNGESFLSGAFRRVSSVVRETLNLGPATARDRDRGLPPVTDTATLLMAQSGSPREPTRAWTLITAPTPSLLSTSLAALSAPEEWQRINGRILAYELEGNRIEVIPAEHVTYLGTLPLSFTNLRLIAANWFSINTALYAFGLVIVAVALGILTWLLVSSAGRRNGDGQ